LGRFLSVAFAYPVAPLSVLLIVVVLYWVLTVVGAADVEFFDADVFPVGIGFGGVPLTVVLSLLTAFSWFACLAGTVLLGSADLTTPIVIALGIVVLVLALFLGLLVTRLLVEPLRHLFPIEPSASRGDFVGKPCVIRTGRVTQDFGQAEVTAADGSTAVVQVRQAGQDVLVAGSSALIFDYDVDGEFFWVVPIDTALGQLPPTH
jgi:hypothetical protein